MSDTMQKFIVYILQSTDLKYNVCKIGSCEQWLDRKGGYITCSPYNAPTLKCVILCSNKKESRRIELILHSEFNQFNTLNSNKYNNGGSEWFEKLPTTSEIKAILDTKELNNKIIDGDDLESYVDDLHRTIREANEKEDEEMLIYEKEELKLENDRKERKEEERKEEERKEEERKEEKISVVSETFEKREYQIQTINKAKQLYNTEKNMLLNWTCGLGKTYVSLKISKLYVKNYLLIGVPSILLIKQWVEVIITLYNLPIFIVSSQNVTIDKIKYDSSTKTDDIQKWLDNNQRGIIITTYHSSHRIPHELFDFKILDECHHLCQTHDDSQFYKIIDIPSTRQLSLTATMKSVESDSYVDNFDKNSFGQILDSKSTCWAIENKYITDYEIVTLHIDEINLLQLMNNIIDDLSDKNLFLSAFSVLQSIINFDGFTHILIYANTIENANKISNYIWELLKSRFTNINDIYNKSLNSETIKGNDLKSEIKKFKESQYGIISSVLIFGEGFDMPKLNGICVAESMDSEIRIVQSTLRANRLEEGNPQKIARIILPYTDNEASFDKIQTIVYKMGNHDKNIEQRIKAGKLNMGESSNNEINCNISFSDSVELQHVKLKLYQRNALQYIGSKLKLEYNMYVLKNQQLNIQSRCEYSRYELKEKVLKNPMVYFETRDPTIWQNWYHYLGIDISKYPLNKTRWCEICKKNKISSSNYDDMFGKYNLPENPNYLYKDFKNISYELNEDDDNDLLYYS
jgi:superfamily II DNA or RNA helicase